MAFRFRKGRGPSTWAFAPRGLDGAQLNFKKITNIAELSERYGSSVAITIEVDTGGQGGGGILFHPNPTIQTIEDSSGDVGGFTQETTLTLSGTCVTNPTQVEVFNQTGSLGFATFPTTSSWTITVSGLPYASNTFYVVSTASDNTTKQSTDSVVLIDEPMVAPTVDSITYGTTTVFAGGTVDVADYDVNGTAQALSTVVLYNGAQQIASTTADANGNWVVSLTGQVDGSYGYTAEATDQYETKVSSNFAFSILIPPPAPTVYDVFTDNSFTKSAGGNGSATFANGEYSWTKGGFVQVADDPRLDANNSDWTISIEIQPDTSSYTAFNVHSMFYKWGAGVENYALTMYYDNFSTGLAHTRLFIQDDVNDDGTSDWSQYSPGAVAGSTSIQWYPRGVWSKHTLVFDSAASNVKYYRDNTLQFTMALPNGVQGEGPYDLFVGAWGNGAGAYWAGKARNLKVVAAALTQAEVQAL